MPGFIGRDDIVKETNAILGKEAMNVDIAKAYERAILNFVIKRQKVTLTGFGIFEIKDLESRKSRDPQTGKVFICSPKSKLWFRPGSVTSRLHEEPGFVKKK